MIFSAPSETDFATLKTLDMRNTNGLVRRSHASVEEGGGSKDDFESERGQTSVPAPLAANSFRDTIRFISNCGPTVFAASLLLTSLATLRSGIALHKENSFFNFLHVWATITLMILSIMGLMNALKIDL